MARQRQSELDWDTFPGPDPLLRLVWPRRRFTLDAATRELPAALARRLRLFGVACARLVWDLLPTEARSAVQVSERFAEGRATIDDLRAVAIRLRHGPVTPAQQAQNAAGWASAGFFGPHLFTPADDRAQPQWDPAEAARDAAKALANRHVGSSLPSINNVPITPGGYAAWTNAFSLARSVEADLLRDIFPPPGAITALDPAWRTAPVEGLARCMDLTGDFSTVAILADALEEAGCTDPAVLGRCRHPGAHVRGNWVVDLVLGR